jgi:hypothetical protein
LSFPNLVAEELDAQGHLRLEVVIVVLHPHHDLNHVFAELLMVRAHRGLALADDVEALAVLVVIASFTTFAHSSMPPNLRCKSYTAELSAPWSMSGPFGIVIAESGAGRLASGDTPLGLGRRVGVAGVAAAAEPSAPPI